MFFILCNHLIVELLTEFRISVLFIATNIRLLRSHSEEYIHCINPIGIARL